MKVLLISSACVCLLVSTLQVRESGGWRGIVPLHSTRANVERLLGPSQEECKCFYKTTEAKIFVEYSLSRCKGFLTGWSVPRDTVLMISVQPEAEMRFSDLAVDLTKFRKSAGTDTPAAYYTDEDSGVRYKVSNSGLVTSIDYIPKRSDYSLRCEGFGPSPDLGHSESKPFDTYSNIPLADERARLDNFSILLHQQPQMKGYVLVYSSKKIPSSSAKLRARHARDYLIRVRHLRPKRIEIVDGGYREQFQIELYILPKSATPPISRPTVAPSAAEKKFQ
jgi:hypothetical protein